MKKFLNIIMKKIIIIGCGGHAHSCSEVINNLKKYKITNYLTNNKNDVNNKILFYSKLNLIKFRKKNIKLAHIGIGQIKNLTKRTKIYNELVKLGFHLPNFISKHCYFSKSSKIGSGSIVMNNAFVNSNVKIGNNVIINNGSIIEHDNIINDDVHIAPGAIINGGVKIGKNSFIGSGAIIKQGLIIPPFTIIQAGKVILRKGDISQNEKT